MDFYVDFSCLKLHDFFHCSYFINLFGLTLILCIVTYI